MTYKKAKSDAGLIFVLESELSESIALKLAEEIQVELKSETPPKKIFFEMGGRLDIAPPALRVLSPLGIELRRKDCMILISGASRELKKFLVAMGVDSLLKPVEAEPVRAPSPPKAAPGLDVEFVSPFIQGTLETLKVQCSIEAKAGKPTARKSGEKGLRSDIAGVIGLTSASFKGSIAICFPAPVFLKAMSNMMGEPLTEINKDLEDGAGELLNIIFGFAKRILNEKGHSIEKAIPTVVRGTDLEIKHLVHGKTVVLPFSTETGEFWIEIAAEPQ